MMSKPRAVSRENTTRHDSCEKAIEEMSARLPDLRLKGVDLRLALEILHDIQKPIIDFRVSTNRTLT